MTGKLVAMEGTTKIDGVDCESISAVLANTFADFEGSGDELSDKDTESKSEISKSTMERLVLDIDNGWMFVSRVCTDFLVGCHVHRSSGISMDEATAQVSLSLSLSLLSISLLLRTHTH